MGVSLPLPFGSVNSSSRRRWLQCRSPPSRWCQRRSRQSLRASAVCTAPQQCTSTHSSKVLHARPDPPQSACSHKRAQNTLINPTTVCGQYVLVTYTQIQTLSYSKFPCNDKHAYMLYRHVHALGGVPPGVHRVCV